MESYKFLFWNINLTNKGKEPKNLLEKQKNIAEVLSWITENHGINFVLLAETQRINSSQLLKILNQSGKGNFKYRNNEEIKRFMAFDNLPNENVIQSTDRKGRITSFYYDLNGNKFLLNLVHLRDQFFNTITTLNSHAQQHATRINLLEESTESENTIVVGDFNLNPYDDGMINANAFNAIMSKRVIKRSESRNFGENEYKYFYNPSWNLLGKWNGEDILGTYYHDNTGEVNLSYWHVLDQLLIRGKIIETFHEEDFKIIYEVPDHKIIKNGIPNKDEYSDHLPIVFTLVL